VNEGADSVGAEPGRSGGVEANSNGEVLPAHPAERKPLWRRVLGVLLSLALILFIFLGVIPQFASYRTAWTAIQNVSPGWWAAILVAAALNEVSFAWPYQAALRHLRFCHGFMETQTATAISNTVPAGGAVAIGMTFRMFGSFLFSNVAITAAVFTTGLWNMAFKLGLPIVAVVLVAVTGQSVAGAAGVALLGVLILAVAGVALWLVFRSPASAHWLGRLGDRVTNWVLHLFHKPSSDRLERSVLRFRDQTNEVVHQRGLRLTAAVLASQVAVFVVLLFSARAVGISASQVSFLEVLLSFAVARLASAIPVLPGGLGVYDAILIGMLTAFGASSDAALAADLVWRATTYFPPIFIGLVTYLVWRRGMATGAYAREPDLGSSVGG
jgi:uncharacterized protein (TIRG00374 family)